MSLILIPGASGCGKSHMMFDRILREAQKHPERRFIVLVPEQNTLQTQKTLVSMSERGGIWNIDVLSFTRLAYRVFEKTGVARRQILSETGKALLLRLIAEREGSRIPLLNGILDRPGSLAEMKSVLSELDQYGIGPDALRGMVRSVGQGGSHPALVRKLSEIALLQEAYESYQAGHFITGEKLPRVLSEKAPLDTTLPGTVICLDGFTGLTPAQLQVITTLLGIAAQIRVTVTIDASELSDTEDLYRIAGSQPSDHELFALSKRTVRALLRCAEEAHVPVEVHPVPAAGKGRHQEGGELEWLGAHFLRSGRQGRMPYPGSPDAEHQIFLRQCADPWDEAVSAAVTIRELTLKGLRYRDIAIVCGSLKDYAEYVRRAMSVYEIPCYIDRSAAVVMNPAFEFVRCGIEILEKNFTYESVMALLRTGLALDPGSGETDLLENYILAAGIRGYRMWSSPFTRRTREDSQPLRDAAEASRLAFMEKFRPFAEVMKKGKAQFTEYAGAVRSLLDAFDVPGKLDALSAGCMEEGREGRAQEYAAVFRVICGVLDEAALLMGAETVSRGQFSEILRAGFSEAKIGILPRAQDQVQVADLERSRLEQIRVVLFLGFNDGYVPRRKTSGGVLTDYEREVLRTQKMRLAPTAREEAGIRQFYLYLALSRPSLALYLSWSSARQSGEEMRPSGILRSLQALFPRAAWAGAASASPFDSVTSLRTGRGVLSQAVGDYLYADRRKAGWDEPRLRELVNLYRREEMSRLQRLSGSAGFRREDLDEETALALYGKLLQGSVTRLEEYAACAFRQFADYGLCLKEREEFTVRTLEIGNLLHRAMELFSRKIREGQQEISGEVLSWRGMTDAQRESLAISCLQEAVELEHGQDLYADSARFAQILSRCEQILLRSVKTIQRQIRAGAFEPAFFELSFGSTDPDYVWIRDLPGGGRMQLGGKIDRIDLCDDEKARRLYIKIVDYKSSAKNLDLERLVEGEQLQLIVYLDAAAVLVQKSHPDREIVCAGAFYSALQDPIVDRSARMTDEELEDAAVGKMKVTGLVNGRMDVVERLDTGLREGEASLVVPVAKNKTPGSLRASNRIITDRQFALLRQYARDRMHRIAASILSGKITPNPSRRDERTTSCTWCPYRDVCGFDPHRRGMAYREKPGRSADENWKIIEQTVSGEE